MHALLLAAGRGLRSQCRQHKILLAYDGVTLLERHMRILAAYPVRHVVIVCGFQKEQVTDAVDSLVPRFPSLHIHVAYNADYALGSALSLACGLNAINTYLQEGESLLLMDGDVLYDGRLIQRLTDSPHKGCLLMDRNMEAGDEPVKIALYEGRIVDMAKRLTTSRYDTLGESVGFFKVDDALTHALWDKTRALIDTGERHAPHEDAIRQLVLDRRYHPCFGVEDVTGTPWMEIDFPHDIHKARHDILPHLQNLPF
ncbi:MAG: phosphocholine cytidylyltransferase family protein [Alphaproteobacteria bacterium GM7ARS4]|nr:phosphocholine cytidylyltransferase family protein [Alphaproteobacteria bacterium GM7ARS4]